MRSGRLSFIIGILAICISSIAKSQGMIFSVKLNQDCPACTIGLRGSLPPLQWDRSINLTRGSGSEFSGIVSFDPGLEGQLLEYKFVLEKPDGSSTWELPRYGNRFDFVQFNAKEDSPQKQIAVWDVAPVFNASQLSPIPSGKLLSDLAILSEALLKVNAGAFRYQTRESLQAQIDQTAAYFAQDRTLPEAYAEFNRLVAQVQCGHTLVNPYNQNGMVKGIIYQQSDKLPFAFMYINEEMIISQNASENSGMTPGSRVEAINGVPISTILDKFMDYVPADGANMGQRYKRLEISGYQDAWELFDALLPTFFPPSNGLYQVTYEPLGGISATENVAAVSPMTRDSVIRARYPDITGLEEDSWFFVLPNNEVGVLQMGSFGVFNFTMDWKKFIKESFNQLSAKKVPNLIIDIRGNGGGADEVLEVLSTYLLKQPCEVTVYQPLSRYRILPASIKPYVNTWDTSVYNLEPELIASKQESNVTDYQFFKEDVTNKGYEASKRAYKGQIYLLVDEACSSATFYLTKIVGECQMATIAGSTTGGNQRGINGGTILFLTLPGTGIEIDIPVVGTYNRNAAVPSNGFKPDIPLEDTRESVAAGQDGPLVELIDRILSKE